jgi:hypothetical protein
MIGAVDEGWWTGDGISSGLLRLAYPALANGVNEGDVEYTSLMYTLYVALTLLSTNPNSPHTHLPIQKFAAAIIHLKIIWAWPEGW